MVQFEDWQIKRERKPGEEFLWIPGEDSVRAELSGIRYTAVEFARISKSISGNSFYRISYEKEEKNLSVKVIYGWLDEKGENLARGYADDGQSIVSPEGAVFLELCVLFFSYEKGEGEVRNLKAEYLGEYEPKPVKLATVALDYFNQTIPVSREYNLNSTLEKIDELCKAESPDIIVLTETFYTRKTLLPVRECALEEDSEPIRLVRERAKKYNTYIAFSFHEVENGVYYNTAFLIDRKGEIAGKYHKSHLTMAELEAGMAPGSEIKVFDTDIGRIAIPVCWDLFFPGYAMEITKQKVDIICHPTAGFLDFRMCQRAKECGAYLIVSTVHDYSASAIYGPNGMRLTDASEHNGYGVVEVDMNKPVYTYWQSYPADTDGTNIYRNESRWDLY